MKIFIIQGMGKPHILCDSMIHLDIQNGIDIVKTYDNS